MSLFQFVNFYASLMYIAFLKGRVLVGYPGRNIVPGITGLEQVSCKLHYTLDPT